MISTPKRDQADAALADQMRGGDADALTAIMRRYSRPLLAYSTKIVREVDLAEEVVQETFVRIWTNRTRLRHGDAVKSYLFRTARNLSLSIARHREVRRRTEPEMRLALQRPTPSALEALEMEQLNQALATVLERLPARRRQAFVLVRVEGLSLGEVAEHMGLSRQTVANHISLALRDLERFLQDFDY